jgi:hypothetical protein
MDNYEQVLNNLSVALNALNEAREQVGKDPQKRLFILDTLINKTEEAIHRWKFRHEKE